MVGTNNIAKDSGAFNTRKKAAEFEWRPHADHEHIFPQFYDENSQI
jgi:hypothetical protein